jgi:hypothetical protein
MAAKQFVVRLTEEERARLHTLVGSASAPARRRYVTAGLAAALAHQAPDREYQRTIDGEQEAHLIALACSARRQGARAGACGCWPSGWWRWRWSRPSRTRRCGRS